MAFMMQEGANGYLLKDEAPEEVERAIRSVYREGLFFPDYVSKAMLDALKTQLKPSPKNELENGQQVSLSDREKEVLGLIGTMPRKEMAKTIYLSVKTIDFHIANLKKKTGCSSTPELVAYAIQNGFQSPA